MTPRPLLIALLAALSVVGAAPAPWLGSGAALAQTLPLTIPADKASRQISVVVDPGLTRTAKLPTEELRQARRDMLAGLDISDENLRALAEKWDGLAAQKFARRLLAQNNPANTSDIAYFASIAISTGRVWTMPEAVQAMAALDPATEPPKRVKVYLNMLTAHAWAGNSLALDALIDLNGEGKLFGPMSAETRKKILAQGAKNGDGRVDLRMAVNLLKQPDLSPEARAEAIGYLNAAMGSNNFAVKTTAANMLANLQANENGATATQ